MMKSRKILMIEKCVYRNVDVKKRKHNVDDEIVGDGFPVPQIDALFTIPPPRRARLPPFTQGRHICGRNVDDINHKRNVINAVPYGW